MNANIKNLFVALALTLLPVCAFAQEDPSEADFSEMEKGLQENIDKMINRYNIVLKLDEWQMFYIDSILNNNIPAMTRELRSFAKSKVSNYDLYLMVQDKWDEKTYQAIRAILDEKQLAKYEKNLGAAKEKKSRDKRAEKNGTLK